ncbi:MAG: zinc ABC transporter substrate-binding protein [Candidatus Yonathbacteria bacterium]|nr:zinc ABC transporter substrate-binding protein [Candidatus Yonathbacteria bacterium]
MKIIINRKFVLVATIFAIVFGAIFLFSSRIPESDTGNAGIRIVASFYPLSYAANAVGGDSVTVYNLVPAGVEPHDFEPSARDLIKIGNADILLYNGAAFEPWIKKWEQGSSPRPKRAINMTNALKAQGVNFIENDGAIDPHFWLDPVIMKSETKIIRDVLSQVDPAHKDLFNENANRLLNSLDALDQNYRAGLSLCTLRDVVVLHKAFNYLAREYQFSAISIAGISPDEEPSPKSLSRITEIVRTKGVKYIFSETVASPKFSELIAREIGGTTLVLNPIESLTPNEVQLGEDYISKMETNLNNLRKAMSCN